MKVLEYCPITDFFTIDVPELGLPHVGFDILIDSETLEVTMTPPVEKITNFCHEHAAKIVGMCVDYYEDNGFN